MRIARDEDPEHSPEHLSEPITILLDALQDYSTAVSSLASVDKIERDIRLKTLKDALIEGASVAAAEREAEMACREVLHDRTDLTADMKIAEVRVQTWTAILEALK